MSDRSQIRKVNVLPVNSYELECELAILGESFRAFSKQYDFTRKCFGVDDSDFIQASILEFITELKSDFIALLAVQHLADCDKVEFIFPDTEEEVISKTLRYAREFNLNVLRSPSFGVSKKVKLMIRGLKLKMFRLICDLREFLNTFLHRSRGIHLTTKHFNVLLSIHYPNNINSLTPFQDFFANKMNTQQYFLSTRMDTSKKMKSMGISDVISLEQIPKNDSGYHLNSLVFNDFIEEYFNGNFPFEYSREFAESFKRNLKRRLKYVAGLYSPIKYLLSQYKPNLVVLASSSSTSGQLLVHLGEQYLIKVIEMTHGMFQDTPILAFQNVPLKLVWSRHQQDLMAIHQPNVVCPIIGNPKHDKLLSLYKTNPPERIIKNKYILFASTPGNNVSISKVTYKSIMKDVVGAARKFIDYDFIFKIHPSEREEDIKELAKDLSAPPNFYVRRNVDVYNILYFCEMVIVVTSTIGFEGLLFDKKIICYAIRNSDRWLPFAKFNLAKSASSELELIDCIEYFLHNDSLTLSNQNKGHFVISDGKSMERFERILTEHIATGRL